MLTSSPLHQRMIPYVSHPIYMHGIYRYKGSRLVRAEGCSNLVCGMYLKCRPVLKYTQSSHIGSIFQVQNHSAVGFCMVAQGEGAKVSGETARSIPTTCGNYLLLCSHVGKLLYRSDPPKLLPKLMPVFSEIGGAFYPSTDTLPALLSGLKVQSTVKIRGTRVPQKAIVPVGKPRPYSIIILNMRFIPKASLRASSQIKASSYILERHL